MKITEHDGKHAIKQAISADEEVQRVMVGKSKEFVERGAKVYTQA